MKKITLTLIAIIASLTTYGQLLPYQDETLEAGARADDLLGRLTVKEKVSLMMDRSPAIERLGIPEYNWWNEALHGVGRAGLATVFPQAIGMAATFDDGALKDVFTAISDEARAKYNDFSAAGDRRRYHCLTFWTPNINIFRDPRWGRGQETYGEDPFLTSRLGLAAVEGLQGDDPRFMKTIACAKHFAVHSGPEWNRHRFDAKDIDQFDLWATYLPAFKTLVDGGVGQVMCAYNRFEGEPCCSNKKLLVDILRNQWGYDKIIVSDCSAIRDFIVDWGHNTHPSGAHAASDAVLSGTDVECGSIYKNLNEAVDKGLIDEKALDKSLRRLLIARFELGEMFTPGGTPWDSLGLEIVDSPEHRALALDMSRKSMVLLKNNGLLPLQKSGQKIMVTGPNANDSVMQWGNYAGTPSHTVTIVEGIRRVVPDVAYSPGCKHVVSSATESRFDLFKDGLKATYYNNVDGTGEPVAVQTYTTPLQLDGGGATVFAPGVNLENFSGIYTGTFVPDADAFYIIEIEAGKGQQDLFVDGELVASRAAGGREGEHKASYMFEGSKGRPVDIRLFFNNGEETATLKMDVRTPSTDIFDAGDADVVIFVGGITPQLEGEEMKVSVPGFRGGDRESIELPALQRQFIADLKKAGKKIVYVNCSGSAVGLAPEAEVCDAIVQAWYPGQDGGIAVADVLFGDYNPGGRLPITFYTGDSQLPDFEDYSMDGRTYRFMTSKPLYPFGHGLSYTTFDYSKARLSAKSIKPDQGVTLSLDIKNTGERDGDEVVQVYVSRRDDPTGTIKTLKGFKRLNIARGATSKVTFELPADAFATFDPATQTMKTMAGQYTVEVGASSDDIRVTLPLTIK